MASPPLLAGFSPTLLLVLNLIGTFVFGLSGGMAGVRKQLLRGLQANAVNVRERDFDALLTREIDTSDTSHILPSNPELACASD